MAIADLTALYPGKADAPDAAYPQGAPRNESAPGANDGTPLEEQFTRDMWGFFNAIIAEAGITPDGNIDTATASQYLAALQEIVKNGFKNGAEVLTTVYTGPSVGQVNMDTDLIGGAFTGNGFYYVGIEDPPSGVGPILQAKHLIYIEQGQASTDSVWVRKADESTARNLSYGGLFLSAFEDKYEISTTTATTTNLNILSIEKVGIV